jgi:hypothetical protein
MLGDLVEQALSTIGIIPSRVSRWLGKECNCEERKMKLNQLHAWAKRVVRQGRVKHAKKYLKSLISGGQ